MTHAERAKRAVLDSITDGGNFAVQTRLRLVEAAIREAVNGALETAADEVCRMKVWPSHSGRSVVADQIRSLKEKTP